jgi:transcriptional regulator with XRE-family HTH domain
MTGSDQDKMTFGEYLRRLRESRNLSQRQVAKAAGLSYAYLSQIEGNKRVKRKKGEDQFAPHPQFLKKLAEVYHVTPAQLFERAGYYDSEITKIYGFSEKNEVDRIFDFLIHDPALKQIFSILDKRAIINRYETLTGKRLITWAGDPDKNPSVNKSEFTGLRCENGMLLADTSNTKLSVKEVAEELGCSEQEVKQMIKNNQLLAKANDFDEFFVEKSELQKFKIGGVQNWIHTGGKIPVAKAPSTKEEWEQQFAALDGVGADNETSISLQLAAPAQLLAKKRQKRK